MATRYAAQKAGPDGRFPVLGIYLSLTDDEIVYDMDGWDYATIQLVDIGSGVVHTGNTISGQQSNDGWNGVAFATPVSFTAAGLSALLTVTAIGYLHVKTTTVGSGAGQCRVHVKASRVS